MYFFIPYTFICSYTFTDWFPAVALTRTGTIAMNGPLFPVLIHPVVTGTVFSLLFSCLDSVLDCC